MFWSERVLTLELREQGRRSNGHKTPTAADEAGLSRIERERSRRRVNWAKGRKPASDSGPAHL